MAFSELNTLDRTLQAVRGRVVVFTNSTIVEFVNATLTRSIPLYSFGSYNTGQGLTFLVEVNGFLSFDVGSYFKIIEVGSYKEFHYAPNAWNIVTAADPYQAKITGYLVEQRDAGLYYLVINLQTGQNSYASYRLKDGFPTPEEPDAIFTRNFVMGGDWKGADAYPFKFVKAS
jgi:hypothetical protein